MKLKKFNLAIVALFSAIVLTGCGVNNDKSLSQIKSDIQKSGKLEKMEKGSAKSLKRFFGLSSSDVDSFVLYTPQSTMDVDEMLIVKLKDQSQANTIEDVIDSRVNKQIESFSGYGPKQVALLQDYEVKAKGKYVFYCVSPNAASLKTAFEDSIKK